jgi:pyruvate,water dikinase
MVVYSYSLYTQFLGQFESYLFQKGESKVVESIKKCWCSCFSERVMSHRLDCGLPTTGLKMAVVIQVESVAQPIL